MTFIETLQNTLHAEEFALLEEKFQPLYFSKGTHIIQQGSQGNGCYLIDEGRVRIEFDTGEPDTDVVMRYVEAGMIVGELSLIDQAPRSTNVYAHIDVTARWLSTADFQALCAQYPDIGVPY